MQGNAAEMPDTAQERRQADRDVATLMAWKQGHSEQCEERETRTTGRFETIEHRFDKLEEYLRGISTKLIFVLLSAGALALWEIISPHINLK